MRRTGEGGDEAGGPAERAQRVVVAVHDEQRLLRRRSAREGKEWAAGLHLLLLLPSL